MESWGVFPYKQCTLLVLIFVTWTVTYAFVRLLAINYTSFCDHTESKTAITRVCPQLVTSQFRTKPCTCCLTGTEDRNRSRVSKIHASHSGRHVFKLQPADWLLWLRVFVVFHSPSNQILEHNIKSEHDRFLTRPFKHTLHCRLYNLTLHSLSYWRHWRNHTQ
jgi:hypothetical protein